MAYTRGPTYIWSDGQFLHLWAEEGRDDWHYMEQFLDKPDASGVQIPEALADQFALMRLAELLKLGQASVVLERALAEHGGNAGSTALAELAPVLRSFFKENAA